MVPRTEKWDPRGQSAPSFSREGEQVQGMMHPWAVLLVAPGSVWEPHERCSHSGSLTYLRVSLRAACSRGSSVVAFWGFSEIEASASRLS